MGLKGRRDLAVPKVCEASVEIRATQAPKVRRASRAYLVRRDLPAHRGRKETQAPKVRRAL